MVTTKRRIKLVFDGFLHDQVGGVFTVRNGSGGSSDGMKEGLSGDDRARNSGVAVLSGMMLVLATAHVAAAEEGQRREREEECAGFGYVACGGEVTGGDEYAVVAGVGRREYRERVAVR